MKNTMNMKDSIELLYDKDFRARLMRDPHKYSRDIGYNLDKNAKIVVKVNSADVIYMPITTNDLYMKMEDLEYVQAAVKLGTAGSAGTLTSFGTLTCPVSCVGSVSSAGTVGSVACKK